MCKLTRSLSSGWYHRLCILHPESYQCRCNADSFKIKTFPHFLLYLQLWYRVNYYRRAKAIICQIYCIRLNCIICSSQHMSRSLFFRLTDIYANIFQLARKCWEKYFLAWRFEQFEEHLFWWILNFCNKQGEKLFGNW